MAFDLLIDWVKYTYAVCEQIIVDRWDQHLSLTSHQVQHI